MTDPSVFAAFIASVVTLMLIPGPNVALIVANSVSWGARYGLLTVAGTSAAMLMQLVLTALGMTGLLVALGLWFAVLRWIGVAYLLYLGVWQWRAPSVDLTAIQAEPKAARVIFTRALLVSLTNPKTLVFYGAFFPQFVITTRPVVPQLVVLCATFLALALLIDSLWALAAARARVLLGSHGRLRRRLSGGALIGAGVALALAGRK